MNKIEPNPLAVKSGDITTFTPPSISMEQKEIIREIIKEALVSAVQLGENYFPRIEKIALNDILAVLKD